MILAFELLISRFILYIVRVKVTTQRRVNDASKDTMIFLSIMIIEIKD